MMGEVILWCILLALIVLCALSWVKKSNQHEGRVEKVENPVHLTRHFVDITDLDDKLKDYIVQEIKWAKEHQDEVHEE